MGRAGFFLLLTVLLSGGCSGETVPKPKAMLRLDYPEARYETLRNTEAFQFKKNTKAVMRREQNGALNLEYPSMKATLFITYKKVENDLNQLLADAQKLTYEHVIRADAIIEQPFLKPGNRVYGMLYEVRGNAASQLQFYATDSTSHFLTGSLYFYARPNYDSILPAVAYMKKDLRTLMESLRWE